MATLLVVVASIAWAAEESPLIVEYDPPRLSIEARDVPLAQVLARIGAAVGFEVVGDASSTAVTISLRRVSVEEALRHLLQQESFTLVYRAQDAPGGSAAVLERVGLLPPPTESSRAVDAPGRRPVDGHAASAAPFPWTPETMPILSWDRAPDPEWAVDAGASPTSVADMLAAHAISGVRAPQEPADRAARVSSASSAAVFSDPASTLAETTRHARQSLASLVHGLATATRALLESQAAHQP